MSELDRWLARGGATDRRIASRAAALVKERTRAAGAWRDLSMTLSLAWTLHAVGHTEDALRIARDAFAAQGVDPQGNILDGLGAAALASGSLFARALDRAEDADTLSRRACERALEPGAGYTLTALEGSILRAPKEDLNQVFHGMGPCLGYLALHRAQGREAAEALVHQGVARLRERFAPPAGARSGTERPAAPAPGTKPAPEIPWVARGLPSALRAAAAAPRPAGLAALLLRLAAGIDARGTWKPDTLGELLDVAAACLALGLYRDAWGAAELAASRQAAAVGRWGATMIRRSQAVGLLALEGLGDREGARKARTALGRVSLGVGAAEAAALWRELLDGHEADWKRLVDGGVHGVAVCVEACGVLVHVVSAEIDGDPRTRARARALRVDVIAPALAAWMAAPVNP